MATRSEWKPWQRFLLGLGWRCSKTSIRGSAREFLEVENRNFQLSQLLLDKRSLLGSQSATRKKIDHSLMCPDRDMLLPAARGRGVFKEGITSKCNELETERVQPRSCRPV